MRSRITDRFLERQRARSFPYTERHLGFEIEIREQVYPPSEDSLVLARALRAPAAGIGPGTRALDFGTGTGIFALVMAALGAHVVATDVSPAAIACAAENARRSGLADRIDFRLGRSFERLGPEDRFDAVSASLPFEAAPTEDVFEQAVYDDEFATRREFFRSIARHLAPGGRIFYAYADYADAAAPLSDFLIGYRAALVAEEKSRDGELNRVYEITRA